MRRLRCAVGVSTFLLALTAGCAGISGLRSPFVTTPSGPDSTAMRARLQEERLQRVEQATAEQGRLLRSMRADQSAQLETLLSEVRALGERLTAVERRLAQPRREAEPMPGPVTGAAGAGATNGGALVPNGGEPTSPANGGPANATAQPDAGDPGPPAGGREAQFDAPPTGGAPPVTNESAAPAGAAELPEPPPEGAELYRTAYQELMEDNYQLALSDLRAFLERYPRTRLSDNAQYWIGEVYYEQKQFSVAVDEFRKVLEEYPNEDKVPAACYKLALSFHELRDAPTTRRYLDLLIDRYPDSREAQLARERRSEFQ